MTQCWWSPVLVSTVQCNVLADESLSDTDWPLTTAATAAAAFQFSYRSTGQCVFVWVVVVVPSKCVCSIRVSSLAAPMEEPKPKVPPRSSLLKKPAVIENGSSSSPPPVNSRPSLPSKPKILSPKPPTPSSSETNSAASASAKQSSSPKTVKQTASRESPVVVAPSLPKTSSVKVCNKLKISASDLNKLR